MIGIVFLNMGGPDSLATVRPFLYNLFSDREIIQLGPRFLQPLIAWAISRRRASKSRAAYAKIGGKSPLATITRTQAKAVEQLLNNKLQEKVLCLAGMRYWNPRAPDVLHDMKDKGISKVLGLSLYPHYSRATSGSSIGEFERCGGRLGLETHVIDSFPDHPGYVEALADVVQEGLSMVKDKDEFALVYSAHSLPKSMVEEGDPYVDHLYRTVTALEELIRIKGHLCYQSRSGPVAWLEPGTDILLNELAEKGFHTILVLPISFVSDHVETLYEVDMLYSEMMAKKGVQLIRTPSLNDRPLFINALSNLVEQGLKKAGWLD
ncbi:MAG: ferrochelatase [Deltaproteobacteria bacterium]|nr:ferrochelatase [Deltaproteobacteria bacterium]MBW1718242.1 ferrochelatase [Deltaproteobacteria bacterium]MBW1963938.1 ferrochelatase [Deltaproteobacteria bacterium]MBW2350499.1 ferrochelatase [Deltaproteobacteria bacterium]